MGNPAAAPHEAATGAPQPGQAAEAVGRRAGHCGQGEEPRRHFVSVTPAAARALGEEKAARSRRLAARIRPGGRDDIGRPAPR